MEQPTLEPAAAGAPEPVRKRKLLVIAIVAILVVAAIGAILAVIYLGGATLRVSTTTPFAAAGESIPFDAVLSLPPLSSAGTVAWNFGDGKTTTGAGTSVSHIYDLPGTYFVAASSSLSTGRTADNFGALFPMYVGPHRPPNGPTDRDSLGVITINATASSPGAPTIPVGGKIAAVGSVQQRPTNATYTWDVSALGFDFGDGSPKQANASADPFRVDHTYSRQGIYLMTLTVTTKNITAGASPADVRTTTIGQTIAAGNYRLVTYAGSIINPGLIVVQEAVTGGFTSLDPGIDYESVGFEIIANTYQTLLWYNGTKTDEFVPVLADKFPSVADGTISADHKTYTFHIRPGAKFADGSPVTAWDVKYSFTRTMLFVFGTPGTSGWIQSQYLLPALDPSAVTFSNVDNAVTVDNASQTVTFHLNSAVPELLWFQIISDPLGSSIVSSAWLEAHGAKLTWTAQGFQDYKKYGDLVNYNEYVRTHTMGSGPFVVDYIVPGEAVALKRNPNFQPTPGIPAPKVDRVFIQYVGEDTTRELSLEFGKADIAAIPSSRFDAALRMQRNGLINIRFSPTLNLFWWNLNLEIAPSPDNNVPSDFLVDLNMRKAFAYAYDYNNYIDNIIGNKRFNAKFAEQFGGIIPKGMIGYENLSYYNVFDMNQAKQFYAQSKWVASKGGVATAGFHLTVVVPTADPVDKAAARAWGDNLQQLGPGIAIDVREISFADIIANMNPHGNPMAIFFLGWLPDYPYPTDYTYPMLQPGNALSEYGGVYPAANGFNISYLAARGEPAQAAAAQRISDWINTSLTSTDLNQVIDLSRKAQREFANLTLYVNAFQQFAYATYRTWISGIELEANPMLGGTDLLYNLLSKQGSSSQAPPSPGLVGSALVVNGTSAFAVARIASEARFEAA